MALPPEIDEELRRIARRWHELPAPRAAALAPDLRALAQSLADRVRAAAGRPPVPLPELGEATLLDQLRVTVYDATAAGQTADLPDRLRALRHAIG
ncbi:hypothetical protein HJ588_00030 [Flexivirga sp. ID2601S]|uniref:Uncharacterized protein n=1 Tax=Flexivirga aerilata TaxID=1656889 RepID=A0A849AAW8_9MICO|nr:hypothetical protein [Flexivirga aerilata]NNG37665.1 hypothetical protein [Flexivirga aerilata]